MGQKIENTEKNYYTMKQSWFKKFGIIYLPVSIIGYLFYFLTVLFCVTVFTAIGRNSHSNSDTLYGVFPYVISAFTVLFWIASNTCAEKQVQE
jgi:hypothetical protein